MEATFDRSSLYEAVAAVTPAVQERSPKPVLQNMHVTAVGDDVVFSGLDLEAGVCIRAAVRPASLPRPGTALVHGTRLAAILRDASAQEVSIKVDGGKAEIKAGSSSFRLNTQDPSDYPELPTFPRTGAATVSGPKLAELIRRTCFAAAQEQGRYAINGVALTVEKGQVEMAATDGKRLAVARGPAEGGAKIDLCIVPPRMLAELRRIAQEVEEVSLAVGGGKLLAQAAGYLVAGNLIEGSYPAYAEMIPKRAKEAVRVKASVLAGCLRQAAHLVPQESRAVVLRLAADKLTVEAKSAAIGEASIEIPVAYSGAAMALAFNPWFFLDILPEFGEEDIALEAEDPDRPAVIRRDDYVYVVAPIKLREGQA